MAKTAEILGMALQTVDALRQHNRAFVASDRLRFSIELALAGGAAFRVIL